MKFKNRKNKIDFIKLILKGQNSISDLSTQRPQVFMHTDDKPGEYYPQGEKEKFLTREEVEQWEQEHPHREIIIINRTIVKQPKS